MTMKPREAVRATAALPRKVHLGVARRLAPIVRHPLASVIAGLGLLLSGVVELLEHVLSFDTPIDAYQGVILLGVVTTLQSLAHMVEGAEWLTKDLEAAAAHVEAAAAHGVGAHHPPSETTQSAPTNRAAAR
ncbi:hypothetical protein F1188_17540 [Roseospira marina]|uniref:Uncharacterized protein n=1 Tax=Roseospira marina TaxID=140057 RepID=A0A5M6I749_9PROT|nr:hypothetical protein [Roseospira marina]KAA5604094.1 hypothetical protein F1188_17540 [Roseospira marina]MBB4315807.1 hypothetical protein [Roseospira marina]MBB5088954.1 hypothetical protein [Roseospira marina]